MGLSIGKKVSKISKEQDQFNRVGTATLRKRFSNYIKFFFKTGFQDSSFKLLNHRDESELEGIISYIKNMTKPIIVGCLFQR